MKHINIIISGFSQNNVYILFSIISLLLLRKNHLYSEG